MTEIERLCEIADEHLVANVHYIESGRARYTIQGIPAAVRAILTAMREPSRPAILAACAECRKEQVRPVAVNIVDAVTVWQAMIDHLLGEGS